VTKVCFFNFYHNGDLFHSKPFVREVIKHLGKEKVMYAHYKDPTAIKDLDITLVRLEGIDHKTKVLRPRDPDILFLNTWIGSYFDKYTGECTLNFNMKMWTDIYEEINTAFGKKMKLGPVENYLPYVDYSKFDVKNVNAFLDGDSKKKILFCNGPAMSGQCEYNGDMGEIITPLAMANPHITFITTKITKIGMSNIIDTSEIIQSDRCDLNEIAYLSKYCDLVIGRNSGPFCFASTGENLNDPAKTFYAFGHQESDCFTMGIPKKSNYIFEKYVSGDQLYNSIKQLVEKV
jgi:hypothetical protein